LCSPPARALPSPLKELSTEELLQQAAYSIEALLGLNEDLRNELAKALERSTTLATQLETSTSALADSERTRTELVATLKISEAYWKRCAEEARVKERIGGIIVGVGIGVIGFALLRIF